MPSGTRSPPSPLFTLPRASAAASTVTPRAPLRHPRTEALSPTAPLHFVTARSTKAVIRRVMPLLTRCRRLTGRYGAPLACASACSTSNGLSQPASASQTQHTRHTQPLPSPRPVRSFSAVARSSVSSSTAAASASASVLPSHFSLPLALRLLSSCHSASSPSTVELVVNLNLDPRKPNQSVRGVCVLPNGTGARLTIAVFARGEKAKEALAAGADIVGAEELVARIQAGDVSFDRCLATPDCMALAGRVARVLGPRGLMPSPKLGSVAADIARAVSLARQGQVEFKTDKGGTVHVGCGRLAFGVDKLAENIAAVTRALLAAKPSGAKGQYLRTAFLHSTHGPSVPLDIRVEPFKVNAGRAAAAAAASTTATAPPTVTAPATPP